MTIRGETSADSAARFIAARSSPSNGLSVMIAERAQERDYIAGLIVGLLGYFPKTVGAIQLLLVDEYGEITKRRLHRILALLVEQKRVVRVADEGYRAVRRSDRT
jgi:hypothetical protein